MVDLIVSLTSTPGLDENHTLDVETSRSETTLIVKSEFQERHTIEKKKICGLTFIFN